MFINYIIVKLTDRKGVDIMKKIILSILVENTSGVLSRISGLFSRRGYNIDSLTVGETQDSNYSRMTVVARGDDLILDQIRKQVDKLEDVKEIVELTDNESVCRELILVKIEVNKKERRDVIAIAEIFRAKIVDVSQESLMIELTGNLEKINAFIKLLEGYTIIQLVRTGVTGLTRGLGHSQELDFTELNEE